MSQASFAISNEPGVNFRTDVNNALQALATLNSGNSAPFITYPFMFWTDTSGGTPILKYRNSNNTSWISIGDLSLINLGLLPLTGGQLSGSITFSNTDSMSIPVGNTAQRPAAPTTAMLRYNTDLIGFEYYNGSSWITPGDVKTNAIQILTNKDIDGGTASDSSRITLPKDIKTNLDSLTRKQGTIVYDTTSNKPFYDDGAFLKPIGSTSGTYNLIDDGDGESGAANYIQGYYTPASRPSGTFTQSNGTSIFYIYTNTVSPLSGNNSLIIRKYSGGSRQGRAVERTIDLDIKYQGKRMQFFVDYKILSGSFVAGSDSSDSSLIWYIGQFNGTSWSLTQPEKFKMLSNSSTISDTLIGEFQVNYDTTKLKLIAYVAEAADSSWYVQAEVGIRPSQYSFGTPGTDPVLYTPNFTGFGTVSSSNISSWRSGAYLSGEGTFTVGTTTAVQAQITLGYAGANTNVLTLSTISSSLVVVGKWSSNTTNQQGVILAGPTRNYLVLGVESASTNGLAPINGTSITTGSVVSFNFRVPIQGWSSNSQVSDGYDGRLIVARYTNSLGSLIPTSLGTAPWGTKDYDDTNSVSSDIFTAKSSGFYEVGLSMSTQSQAWAANSYFYAGLAKNGTSVTQTLAQVNITSAITAGVTLSGNAQIFMLAGDTLRIRYMSSDSGHNLTASSVDNWVTFKKLQAPTTISMSDLVAFYAYSGSPTGTIASSYNTVIYGIGGVFYDSHGCYSNGVYTFRDPGLYSLKSSVQLNHTTAAGYLDVGLSYNNGAPFVADYKNVSGVTDSTQSVSGVLNVKSGDTIRTQIKTTLTSASYSSNAAYNYFIIKKIK